MQGRAASSGIAIGRSPWCQSSELEPLPGIRTLNQPHQQTNIKQTEIASVDTEIQDSTISPLVHSILQSCCVENTPMAWAVLLPSNVEEQKQACQSGQPVIPFLADLVPQLSNWIGGHGNERSFSSGYGTRKG